MSRKIENITNSFRKAREEGEQMLRQGRLCWADFCEIMRGFEQDLANAGVVI
jgi:hypothetical protein